MFVRAGLSLCLAVALASAASAQTPESTPPAAPPPAAEAKVTPAPAAQAEAKPAAPPPAKTETKPTTQPAGPLALNYSGDLWSRRALTGDWGGVRNQLANKGVQFDMQVVQYGLGNAYGGKSTNSAFQYSGTADYSVNFDFQKMGLWPGGFARVRGETIFGRSINGDSGAISPPNFDALLPAPNDPGLTTLTEYWIMQFVSEKLGFIAGQVDLTGLPGGNVFASGRYDQFMNTSLWYNPTLFSTVPYSAMTAGAIYMPTEWLSGATLVVDSYGVPSYSGFESAFTSPQAVTVLQNLTFNVKPFGLEGHQRLYFSWSSRERYPLKHLDRLALSGVGAPQFDRLGLARTIVRGGRNLQIRNAALRAAVSRLVEPSQESGNWAFWYNFDQFVYTKPDDSTQGWGVFGGFGWSPGVLNPIAECYTLGLGGRGLIPTREKDTYGLGYYYVNVSNELPGIFNANAEQGVELYYNVEVTPWLHITPDLQVIVNPGGATGADQRDPAIVYGLRAQLNF